MVREGFIKEVGVDLHLNEKVEFQEGKNKISYKGNFFKLNNLFSKTKIYEIHFEVISTKIVNKMLIHEKKNLPLLVFNFIRY